MMKLAVLLVVGVIARQAYCDEPEQIIGGNIAMDGDFPHQVALELNYGRQTFHVCGGSIISEYHVVSAAHCLEDEYDNKVMEVVTGTNSPALRGERHKIKCIRLHPKYTGEKNGGWIHDIAVITVATPMKKNKLQRPIPLPTQDYSKGGHRGIISGWGKTNVNSDSSGILKWVEVNVLSEERCLAGHKNPRTNPKQICTLEKVGKGACQGDSGGPLIVNGELCGVVSWVLPCALGVSDVFTHVYHYLDFIKECQQMC